jgi:hypothetical protein
VLEVALRPYEGKQTWEYSMVRTLHDSLAAGDVVLADRYFSGWFDLALRHQRGVDVVGRKHQLRPTDFHSGRQLGHNDQIVHWKKPARPDGLSREDHTALPGELELREVRVHVTQGGFRPKSLVNVTTLLDADEFSAVAIADLYRQHWQIEAYEPECPSSASLYQLAA